MYDNLGFFDRKARKRHKCDWCGGWIEEGEQYTYQKFVWDGTMCDWKSHKACERVVNAIWGYCEPDEGLGKDDFYDYGTEVCRQFICPDCPNWDKEDDDCKCDKTMCIDRMDEFFKSHELYATREGYYRIWRCREKVESDALY